MKVNSATPALALGVPFTNHSSWQWQPTLGVHDPNPPITILDPDAAATAKNYYSGGFSAAKRLGRGLGFGFILAALLVGV